MPMVLIVALVGREREEKNSKVLELKEAYQGTTYLLGDMIEATTPTPAPTAATWSSSSSVSRGGSGLDADEQRMAEFTALLHDVGKIRTRPRSSRSPARSTTTSAR